MLKQIADCTVHSLRAGGHIYYVSSCDHLALCGLIDASECKPTYGAGTYLYIQQCGTPHASVVRRTLIFMRLRQRTFVAGNGALKPCTNTGVTQACSVGNERVERRTTVDCFDVGYWRCSVGRMSVNATNLLRCQLLGCAKRNSRIYTFDFVITSFVRINTKWKFVMRAVVNTRLNPTWIISDTKTTLRWHLLDNNTIAYDLLHSAMHCLQRNFILTNWRILILKFQNVLLTLAWDNMNCCIRHV